MNFSNDEQNNTGLLGDIKLNTPEEIPYLWASMYYFLFIIIIIIIIIIITSQR